MGGSSGGGGISGPSQQETQNQALTNQLLQRQIEDADRQRAADAAKQTPAYLNQQRDATRTAQMSAFDTSKNANYQQARQNIIKQFTDFGDPNGAAPYLQQLDQQYAATQYHNGGDYTSTTNTAPGRVAVNNDNFNEEAYLAANPDVAAAINGHKGQSGYWQTGREQFDAAGSKEGRTQMGDVTTTSLVNPTSNDYWDDPTKLLNNDFGASSYITGQRTARRDADYTTAQSRIGELLGAYGLDDTTRNTLTSAAYNRLDNLKNTAGVNANDYDDVFDVNSILDSVTGNERATRRAGYTTAARAAFNGYDPTTDLADTADDQYISDIVGKQYGDAQSALERAKARGALTDTGYQSGMSYLGDQRKTADTNAQALGGAALTRLRGDLSGIKDKAISTAGSWDFGQTYDPNTFKSQYDTKKGEIGNNLGGEIATALSGQNWFDVGDVLNKAGYAQGAQNTAALTDGFTTPAGAAAALAKDKNKEATRGIGGTGVF